jgi:hypothetical protein
VAGGVEHTLVHEDAAGRRELLENRALYVHGITET